MAGDDLSHLQRVILQIVIEFQTARRRPFGIIRQKNEWADKRFSFAADARESFSTNARAGRNAN